MGSCIVFCAVVNRLCPSEISSTESHVNFSTNVSMRTLIKAPELIVFFQEERLAINVRRANPVIQAFSCGAAVSNTTCAPIVIVHSVHSWVPRYTSRRYTSLQIIECIARWIWKK